MFRISSHNRLARMIGFLLLLHGGSLAETLTVIRSNFDDGLDGWVAWGIGIDASPAALSTGSVFLQGANPDMEHDNSGQLDPDRAGETGGFARLNDVTGGLQTFARAPAKFTGDLSPFFFDGSIDFTHRLFTPLGATERQNARGFTILFVSGDLNDLNAWGYDASDARGDFVWTPGFEPFFDDDAVRVGAGMKDFALDPITDIDLGAFDPSLTGSTLSGLSGGSLQTSMTLEQVLANVTDIFITLERIDNDPLFSEQSGIDDVTMSTPNIVPVPAKLTSFIRVDEDLFEGRLTGTANTVFEFRSSATLAFNPGTLVAGLTQGSADDPGEILGVGANQVRTDEEGRAVLRMTFGGASRQFVRAREQ